LDPSGHCQQQVVPAVQATSGVLLSEGLITIEINKTDLEQFYEMAKSKLLKVRDLIPDNSDTGS
jgi:hypothetical protein